MTRMKRATFADLHYRLGELVEDKPGMVAVNGARHDSNVRAFDCLTLDRSPNWPVSLDLFLEESEAEYDAKHGEGAWQRMVDDEWDAA